MKIEQQVTSLEISKKLKELGVKQESVAHWLRYSLNKDFMLIYLGETPLLNFSTLSGELKENYSAFTVAELGNILPSNIHQFEKDDSDPNGKWFSSAKTDDNTWVAGYGENSTNEIEFEANTEADARSRMLIYLLENNLVHPH